MVWPLTIHTFEKRNAYHRRYKTIVLCIRDEAEQFSCVTVAGDISQCRTPVMPMFSKSKSDSNNLVPKGQRQKHLPTGSCSTVLPQQAAYLAPNPASPEHSCRCRQTGMHTVHAAVALLPAVSWSLANQHPQSQPHAK